jgi:hypothetical protein
LCRYEGGSRDRKNEGIRGWRREKGIGGIEVIESMKRVEGDEEDGAPGPARW